MSGDDEIEARLLRLADALRVVYDNRVLAAAEAVLNDTPSLTWPPAPNTAHPAFSADAETIRYLMALDRSLVVCVAKPERVDLVTPSAPVNPSVPDYHQLQVRKAAGPAPYVGRPFFYMWRVATDQYNRWVTGPAELRYLPG